MASVSTSTPTLGVRVVVQGAQVPSWHFWKNPGHGGPCAEAPTTGGQAGVQWSGLGPTGVVTELERGPRDRNVVSASLGGGLHWLIQ